MQKALNKFFNVLSLNKSFFKHTSKFNLMKRKIFTLAICLLFSWSIAYSQTTRIYSESSEVIANPDRGLQKYSITDNSYNTITNYSNLSQSTLTGWRTGADKIT